MPHRFCSPRAGSHLKQCDKCGERIPATAKVCRQCRNFQGAWWWFRLAGLSVAWLTAIGAFAPLAYDRVTQFFTPLDRELFFFSTVEGNNLKVEIYSSHSKPVFIVGSFFVCNKIENPDAQHYLSVNIADLIDDKTIKPNERRTFSFQLSKEAVKASIDKTEACRISAIIDDYRGKSTVLSRRPIVMGSVEIKGTYVSP